MPRGYKPQHGLAEAKQQLEVETRQRRAAVVEERKKEKAAARPAPRTEEEKEATRLRKAAGEARKKEEQEAARQRRAAVAAKTQKEKEAAAKILSVLRKHKEREKAAVELQNPFTILSKAKKIATSNKGELAEFKPETFISAMKTMLLGSNFNEFKNNVREEDRKVLEVSEKKLDADLKTLADSMAQGIKDGTLHEPMKNGLIRKGFIAVVKTIGTIVSLVVTALGAVVSYNAAANRNNTKAATVAAVGGVVGGFVGYKLITSINRFINAESESSTVEAQMDALVESVDKDFTKQMAKITSRYAEKEQTGAVTEEEKVKAAERIQSKKWLGGMRKGPSDDDIDAEVAQERARIAKEARAVSLATKFQDRFQKLKEQGKTFEEREAAKKREGGSVQEL